MSMHDAPEPAHGHPDSSNGEKTKYKQRDASIDTTHAETSGDPRPSTTSRRSLISPHDDNQSFEASSVSESQIAMQPISIKAVDEDAGPKEFYHPASVEPQRVVWLPVDTLGLGVEEERALKEAGVLVSTEGAKMDEKGHVDISGPPPGGDVRTL